MNQHDEDQRREDEEEEEIDEEQIDDEQELDDRDKKISQLEEELAKEREKEKNFKNLKTVEKTKRMKISERVERMEKMLEQEQQNRQILQDSMMQNAKNTALDQLVGEDKDLREKLIERVKNSEAYLGAPKDDKELVKRFEAAYGYIEGTQRRVNPLNSFNPVTGTQTDLTSRKKKFTDTPEGKKLFEEKFPQISALNKKK